MISARASRYKTEEMSAIAIAALAAAPLHRDPFDYVIVPGFLSPDALAAIHADFPAIARGGSFPVTETRYGPAFADLLGELRSPALRDAFADKFEIDLGGRPSMITVRGRCQAKDGRIHTDTANKIVTALLYLNPPWEGDGGRLRLLRSAGDIEDMADEVPPNEGTLLAFRRSENSYHGHKPYVGERRVVQLNWVTGRVVVWRELARHRVSAWLKRATHTASAAK